jgi:hypothetical protein
MDIRHFRKGWPVVLIVLLAHTVLAASYEVQITREQHDRFVKAAKVWHEPLTADLLSGEANGYRILDRVDCKFVPYKFPGGRTPKFLCAVLDESGNATKDIIKIKYGRDNREIPGEVAGGNLLRHLGFGGDHMQVARTLICYGSGCPKGVRPSEPIQHLATPSNYEVLEWVSVERRMEGRELLVGSKQGFSMSELAAVRNTSNDAKIKVDALLLLLAFVNHADSKSANQRLMCLPDQMDEATHECLIPFAMVHDTGTFFGSGSQRKKPELSAWASERVFSGNNCTVQVHSGWSGAHFPAVRISEDGRQFLLKKLEAMIDSTDHNQIRNLFAGAHMDMDKHSTIDGWVKVFIDKVREIQGTGPCAAPDGVFSTAVS